MAETSDAALVPGTSTQRPLTQLLAKHVLLPVLCTAALVALYFTPVSLVGCAARGLIAFGIALVSLLAGIVCAVFAIRLGRGVRGPAAWWVLSAIILMLPALLLLGPLG